MAQVNFRYEFNWKLTLFTVLLLPLLCRLGFWQLSRAEEKLSLHEAQRTQQALPPLSYRTDMEVENFRRIEVEGRFDTQRYWLIEGRHQKGRLGYEVLMPLQLGTGRILVNRGWVPAGAYRSDNPELSTPSGILNISGTLVSPSDSPLINDKTTEVEHWPQRILEIDVDLLGQQYGENFASKVLQIDAEDTAALAVEWRSINMSPQKHTAYAVQWFSMALVLTVLWVFASSNLAEIIKRSFSASK